MDLTLLYYSASRINKSFASNVRRSLVAASEAPLVAVLQNTIPTSALGLASDFKNRLESFEDVGHKKPSIWQVYQNVLIGARMCKTPFVACCEDDTVYSQSHFLFRPDLDTFAYDRSRWVITRKLSDDGKRRDCFYYWRERHQMAMCIAPRALLIETLEEKFAKYPESPVSTDVAKKAGWGEPGRYEKNLKLTLRKMEYFDSPEPSVTFNHSESLMGRRRVNPDDVIREDLPPWGNANALWERICG